MNFKRCPQCDFENPETAKFCNECGSKLDIPEIPPLSRKEPAQEPLPPSLLLTTPRMLEVVPAPAAAPPVGQGVAAIPSPTEEEAEDGGHDAKEEPPDQPFGERYRIVRELGTGTLGTVYEVFDKAMERELALKTVRPELSQKADAFVGFSRELKIERAIVHKNIARIFELNVLRGTPVMAMEYVAGTDLRRVLKEKKRFSAVAAISIARQLFSGLAHAHMVGALHLDLKPENIMIDKEGTLKIMDLGILRLFRAKGIIGSTFGKPQYMSPELLEGQEVDVRADIFAAGVIIYELLTSSLPPIGQTVRSPREIDPRIPQPLSLLVLRCIEQDKEKRYQSAEEIRAELEVIETIAKQAPREAAVERPNVNPAPPMSPARPAFAAPVEPGRPTPAPAAEERPNKRPFPRPFPKPALRALAAFAGACLIFLAYRLFFWPSKNAKDLSAQPPQVSLAVLPFKDLSSAEDRSYLGVALAETLIHSLGRIDNLFIPAAESSSTLRGEALEAGLIVSRLHVDRYLEGTLEERDSRIKMDVRLLRTDSSAPLWSGQFERPTAEVFALVEEVSVAVAKSLGMVLPPGAASGGGPASFEAYDLYAQARYLASRKGKQDLERSIDLFVKAADKDPSFAAAFAGLGEAYAEMARGHYWTPDKAFPKAKEAAVRALTLDNGSSDAHTTLAGIKLNYEWDFASAEKEYLEALRLDPQNAAAHRGYAVLLSALGRNAQAIREIQTAQNENPLSSDVMAQAVSIYFYARLYQEAVAEAQKALAADPSFPGHYLNAALILIQLNQVDQAVQSLKEAEDLGSDRFEVGLLRACLYARQGRRQEVGQILTEALNAGKQVFVSQVSLAFVYAALGEKEQAIACLENAYNGREASLVSIRAHPFLDPVRGDARFSSLLKSMGFGTP